MTPDDRANKSPITPETVVAELANLIRMNGAASVESKLPNELFGSNWQVAEPSDTDNPFSERGTVGYEIPERASGIPNSPEPLAATVQYLNSYSSMKTKGRNQLIVSAPVTTDHPRNKNILHRFQEPFRQLVISLELPQEGFTTRRSGSSTTTSARFKFFLPDEKAMFMFTKLKSTPETIPLLLRELWPGTQRVTLSSDAILTFVLAENPNNQAEAAEVFARMNT